MQRKTNEALTLYFEVDRIVTSFSPFISRV